MHIIYKKAKKMDIENTDVKKKGEYKYNVKNLMGELKYKKNPIYLLGSSSLKSQLYPSDYDFFTPIKKCNKIFFELYLIFKKLFENDGYYIREIKIEYPDKKTRFYSLPEFKNELGKLSDDVKEVNYVKIDFVIYDEELYLLKDVSCIYNMELQTDSFDKKIKEEMNELEKEKKYYKVLKRLYSLLSYESKISNDDKKKHDINKNLKLLSKIFNSELGKLYQNINNVSIIETISNSEAYKMYTDRQKAHLKKIFNNIMKSYNLKNLDDVKKYVDDNTKILNEKAYELYKLF